MTVTANGFLRLELVERNLGPLTTYLVLNIARTHRIGENFAQVVEQRHRQQCVAGILTGSPQVCNLQQSLCNCDGVCAKTTGLGTMEARRSRCLIEMIEMWLSEMTDKHTTIEAREYVEAYINDEESKTLVFPIIELEELVYQKAVKEKYHIVCERGTQDGISRAMGNKVIDFKDMNNESMPAHKYDDDGIRRDGINPLTHSGYWEEEQ